MAGIAGLIGLGAILEVWRRHDRGAQNAAVTGQLGAPWSKMLSCENISGITHMMKVI